MIIALKLVVLIDSLTLFREYEFNAPSFALPALFTHYFGRPPTASHSAAGDVEALEQTLNKMLELKGLSFHEIMQEKIAAQSRNQSFQIQPLACGVKVIPILSHRAVQAERHEAVLSKGVGVGAAPTAAESG